MKVIQESLPIISRHLLTCVICPHRVLALASEEETVRKKVSRICQNFLRELFVEIVWSLFRELVSEWV